ncbi:N-acetylmannosamine kinase [Planococcus halocryophilus Or1]|uniref:ROK family protein n=1 Tax=Planococcus halocryophilus TaxID=1215089 RepID=A0A1C7DS03_9BACL|nr:ROK family protein [Planococcus halocryophilus]ANU14430.1 ROK family protein [Planococcus halocryophilus]EMF48069.1 N-acetylmannosamine kinase [Planococcus halocryophilus Or1]
MLLAVFDIGGTNIKYGVGDSEGYLVVEKVTSTEAFKGGGKLVGRIKTLTKDLQKDWAIEGVAISTAGSIDSKAGKVIYATETIPGYSGMNVKQILETELQLPVELENDVHCGALGELSKDVSSDAHNLLFLTIGTGIGGSLALNGQIHKGSTHLAGAIGHMNLYPNGRLCLCGQRGCFEQYASASRLEQKIQEVNPQQQLPAFMEKVKCGDNASVKLFHEWLDDLALGLQSLIYIWNPDSVVIGGGISAQGKWLEQEIEKAVFRNLLDPFKEKLTIRLAKNGNRSNLLGAIKNYELQQVRRGAK